MDHHNNHNHNPDYSHEDIQSSAAVDERFLQTHSTTSARYSFDSLTKCDETPSHFAASIERFFQSEVRPLYFSKQTKKNFIVMLIFILNPILR